MCSACSRRGTACTYSKVDRRRGKLKKNETDALQEKVRNLDIIVTTLSIGSDQEALALLQRLRAKPSSTPSQIALRSGNGLDDRHKSPQKVVDANNPVCLNPPTLRDVSGDVQSAVVPH
jgi:hypothetical protein